MMPSRSLADPFEAAVARHLRAKTEPVNGTETLVWTDSELIVWSGIRSLPEPLRRGGFVYDAAR